MKFTNFIKNYKCFLQNILSNFRVGLGECICSFLFRFGIVSHETLFRDEIMIFGYFLVWLFIPFFFFLTLIVNPFANLQQDEEDEQAFILTLVEIPTNATEGFTDASMQLMPSSLLPAPILVKSGNTVERGGHR